MIKTIFSGIQPSGELHIGNYIGAISQWVKMQKKPGFELIFSIVDLHAITVDQEPTLLRKRISEITAIYLAAGINPKKSKIFVQSENPDHTSLAWIFDCITPFSWLKKMTQFKDKSAKRKEQTSVGLFNYPALMAADILLYDADFVPVGDDQIQHIELTRNIAERFNSRFGETFKLPEAWIDEDAARVMSLQDPIHKMSKSDPNEGSRINMLDSKDIIVKKIMRAITDSGSSIIYDREKKPAISNLLVIFSRLSGKSVDTLEKEYKGKGYGQFKKDLAEVVVETLTPIQKKYNEFLQEKRYLEQILDTGINYVRKKSSKKIRQVEQVVGLGRG